MYYIVATDKAFAQAADDLDVAVKRNGFSVFTENGSAPIGVIKPAAMLAALSAEPAPAEIAQQVEEKILQMVEEAK